MAHLDPGKMIPVAMAIAVAEARLPGGFVVSAGLDLEDVGTSGPEQEPLSYEVVVYVSETREVWHVGVDAVAGTITEAEVEDTAEGEVVVGS